MKDSTMIFCVISVTEKKSRCFLTFDV